MSSIKVETTIEVWQIWAEDKSMFVNLDTEPGLLRFDTSVTGGRVLAVLAWKSKWGEGGPEAVVLANSTERLEEFLSNKEHEDAHWKVLWRSDHPIVVPTSFRFRGHNKGA